MFLLQESQSERFQNQGFLERTQILIGHELTPCRDELTNVFYELILIRTPLSGSNQEPGSHFGCDSSCLYPDFTLFLKAITHLYPGNRVKMKTRFLPGECSFSSGI